MQTLYYILWIGLIALSLYQLLIEKREPASTWAWILVVVGFPIVGALVFQVFGPQRLERQALKRRLRLDQMLDESSHPLPTELTPSEAVPEDKRAVFQLLHNISEYRTTTGNSVNILADPQEALAAMRGALQSAKHFIHVEYYIIRGDDVSRQLFSDLEMAADRGVEVRILYDSLGSLFLKRRTFKKLLKSGAQVAGFLPLVHFPKRLNLNFRNHRKILIVDGEIAFTGGANIGRQYLGIQTDAQWRDNFVAVRGPACLQLQDVFAKDWHFTTKEDIFSDRYYPKPKRVGSTTLQVLESGPDSKFFSLEQAVILALAQAKKSVRMTTPYFIPDAALLTALIATSLRGVTVSLILPKKTDNRMVRYAARSYYEYLLQAGVQIYEYRPRILHSKMLIIDDELCVLGSANMDVRSFRLNFELNLWISGAKTAREGSEIFKTDLEHCDPIAWEQFESRGVTARLLENTCRLFSPML